MSSTIHGLSTKALKYLKRPAATVAVYLCYIARQNKDSVAWPSLAGLSRDTGWDKNTCMEARHKLVELGALELVKDYLHPKWRGLSAQELTRVQNISRIEFYRVTGSIEVEGVVYPILYTGASETNDIDEVGEGENPPMSEETRRRKKPDVGTNQIELDSNGIELSSRKKRASKKATGKKTVDNRTPAQVAQDAIAQAWQNVVSFGTAPAYLRKEAAALIEQGATPDLVAEMAREKQAGRDDTYKLAWLAEDFGEWLAERQRRERAAAQAAAVKAQVDKERAWMRELIGGAA